MKKTVDQKDFQWYIVSVVTGNEDAVVKNLWGKIEAYGLSEYVSEIRTIKDKFVEEQIYNDDNLPNNYGRNTKNIKWETFKDANGNNKYKKIKTTWVNRFQGYIFIKMVLTEQVWFAIRNTQLITGIVGSSGKNAKPIPVSDIEIMNILDDKDKSKKPSFDDDLLNDATLDDLDDNFNDDELKAPKVEYECDFDIGQNVKIINGPFKDSIGVIRTIDKSKGICLITINLFGRDTDTEISFSDIVLDK